MSERGSFTTEFIYNDCDYNIVRQRLEDDRGKYLCCAPPPYWEGDGERFYMPIVSGKVGGMMLNTEWEAIVDCLSGVKTETEIRCVVMCDAGSVILIKKAPDGTVEATALIEEEEEE